MIDPRVLSQMAGALALGAELAITVVGGTLAGHWLDEKLGTAPVLLLLLSLGALIVGFVRLTLGLQKSRPPDDPEPDEPRP